MFMDLKENKVFIIPSFLGNLGFFCGKLKKWLTKAI